MKLPQWMPSEEVDAQAAHVGWGAVFVLAAFALGCGWYTLAIVPAWVVGKEFVFDLAIERDSVMGSAIDGAFYFVGAALGGLVLWIAGSL